MSQSVQIGVVGSGVTGNIECDAEVVTFNSGRSGVTIDVEYAAASLAAIQGVRKQLLGYLDQVRPQIGLTWAEDSSLNGFYVLEGLSITNNVELFTGWTFRAQITLTLIGLNASAWAELSTVGTYRDNYTNFSTINTPRLHLIAPASWGYPRFVEAVTTNTFSTVPPTRTGGGVPFYDTIVTTASFSALGPYTAQYPSVTAANFYDGHVKLTDNLVEVTGTKDGLSTAWKMDNGLVEITPANNATDHIFIRFRLPSDAAWTARTIGYTLGIYDGASRVREGGSFVTAPHVSIVSNSEASTTIALFWPAGTVSTQQWGNTVMYLTLRRGSRILYLSGQSPLLWASHGLRTSTGGSWAAPSSQNNGLVEAAADSDGMKLYNLIASGTTATIADIGVDTTYGYVGTPTGATATYGFDGGVAPVFATGTDTLALTASYWNYGGTTRQGVFA